MTQPTDKYLGDGLYVSRTQWEVELYAHDGLQKTNRVFLDASTLGRFLAYLEEHGLEP